MSLQEIISKKLNFHLPHGKTELSLQSMENYVIESLSHEQGNKEHAAQKGKVINKNVIFLIFLMM